MKLTYLNVDAQTADIIYRIKEVLIVDREKKYSKHNEGIKVC